MTNDQKELLRLEQVSLAAPLGLQYLLQDVSLSVFQGDRLCLIGPSGAGKTSLLRLLNRLEEPTRGTIYLEKQKYQQISAIQLRRQVMLLLQEPKLLGMTVQEALSYPLVLQGDRQQAIKQRLVASMELLHIPEDWLNRTELQLSLGQRQLVALARALVIEPKVLLLDEPTSALDAGRAAYVLGVLTQLCESGKTTVVMVNHQLDLAQHFSTRVLYLQSGQLVQDAPAENLDWRNLGDRLIKAEAQAAEEWT